MRTITFVWLAVGCSGQGGVAQEPEVAPAPPPTAQPTEPAASLVGPRVFFVEPADGAEVASPVRLAFGAQDVPLRAAASADGDPMAGHFLVLEGGPLVKGEVVSDTSTHRALSGGEAETQLALPPGAHQLTVQFVGNDERSFGPELSATIRVRVR